MKNKIFVPSIDTANWKALIPQKHWKKGYSARALANCWQKADGFPEEIQNAFNKSAVNKFKDIEMLFGFPEYKVSLNGSGGSSHNDIFILAKGDGELISIMVEGKVSEGFGKTIKHWNLYSSENKRERLNSLLDELGLGTSNINHIRYQLLHRAASAIKMARKLNAKNALMLIHSFSKTYAGFDDFKELLFLFKLMADKNVIVGPARNDEIDIYFCWVRGNENYLNK